MTVHAEELESPPPPAPAPQPQVAPEEIHATMGAVAISPQFEINPPPPPTHNGDDQ
jgi:hypothetical protein